VVTAAITIIMIGEKISSYLTSNTRGMSRAKPKRVSTGDRSEGTVYVECRHGYCLVIRKK